MVRRPGNEASSSIVLLPQVMSPKFDHLTAQPQVIGELLNIAHMYVQ